MKQTGSNLMTQGKVSATIVRFALPIFWGNLFQNFYNLVDGLVVGNVVGMRALAAITSTGSLTFLIIGLFNGIFMGSSVVISKYFGSGDNEKVRRAIHTDIGFALLCSAVMTLLGVLVAPRILTLMSTPADVFDMASSYLTIHFAGITTMVLYNTASGIFHAVGDSHHPLIYLITSSLTNMVLDILFVRFFGWGVEGAAIATIIAQLLSVVLSFHKLTHVDDVHRVRIREICLDRAILREIVNLGIPSGIQNSVIGLANVVVQSNINVFGAAAAAGYGASARLEGFVFIPITSLSLAMATFEGQNLGAHDYARAKKGANFGIVASIIVAETIGVLIFLLAPQAVALFTDSAEAIAIGARKNRTAALFYFALALSHCFAGILRGAGRAKTPMFVMLGTWCLFRVAYIQTAVHFVPDNIDVVFWAYPITWLLSTTIFFIYYVRSDWLHGFERR